MTELEHAIEKIKWDILGISDIRKNYESITERKSQIIFSHNKAINGQQGTGFCINSKWKHNIRSFKSINERIALLILKFDKQTIKIINVHAPNSESPEERMEEFHETLGDILTESKNTKPDITVLMGDFNGKIGKRDHGEHFIMGH